jgi:NADPH:quinone reductase-like Zn-dependent oxidoreductase
MPVVYLTAHHMMFFTGHLRPRSKVLVHSAAGGVGLAAIQLAKTRACEVFGIASKSKHDFLREHGCDHPIDSAADYVAAVRAISERGVDLVLDPAGGKSWDEGYRLLAPAGRLVAFGFSNATPGKKRSVIDLVSWWLRVPKWSPIDLMDKNRTVSGTNMGHLFGEVEMLREQLSSLLAMYDRREIVPYVDRSFPFSEAAAAHHYIHDRKSKGKVLLVPDA